MLGAALCVVAALAALFRVVEAGLFVEHALAAASHHVQASAGWLADVFSF